MKLITALLPFFPALSYCAISIMVEEGSGFKQSITPRDSLQAGPFEKKSRPQTQ